jgi:hypothetical protein
MPTLWPGRRPSEPLRLRLRPAPPLRLLEPGRHGGEPAGGQLDPGRGRGTPAYYQRGRGRAEGRQPGHGPGQCQGQDHEERRHQGTVPGHTAVAFSKSSIPDPHLSVLRIGTNPQPDLGPTKATKIL